MKETDKTVNSTLIERHLNIYENLMTILYRIQQELNQHLCLRLQTHVKEYTGIDIFMKYLLIS